MEENRDRNIYMMCDRLERGALCELPAGFHVRPCRPDELAVWRAMPFDDPEDARAYDGFMRDYFRETYGGKEDLFFARTLFACDADDRPVATCLVWKAHDAFNSIHWLKTLKGYEGLGLGRALLSLVMRDLPDDAYPVYLHTHPECGRAIKLYSDFGFALLSGPMGEARPNDLEEGLEVLRASMPPGDFQKLRIAPAPEGFSRLVAGLERFEF